MIIYVNGDSHAAAAEAAVPYGWAQDDEFFWGLGRRPHPENERVSFGCEIANHFNAVLDCDAQSGASNARIMRTTRDWLARTAPGNDSLVIIHWSTWEREEWLIDGEHYQVGASGTDSVPDHAQDRYRGWIADINWKACAQHWHQEIWQLHRELLGAGIRHVFFNGNCHFGDILDRHDWQNHYIGPYDATCTYDAVLRQNGFHTVSPKSWHFGADAHCFWAGFLLQYIDHHNLGPQ